MMYPEESQREETGPQGFRLRGLSGVGWKEVWKGNENEAEYVVS